MGSLKFKSSGEITLKSHPIKYLFVCALIVFVIGNGLLPILPKHFKDSGVETIMNGVVHFLMYLSLAIGGFFARWLRPYRFFLFLTGVLCIPTLWALGLVNQKLQQGLLICAVWLLLGVALTIIYTFAEELKKDVSQEATDPSSSEETAKQSVMKSIRNFIFGVIGMASPLASMISGFSFGDIEKHWGYPTLFRLLAFLSVFIPTSVFFLPNIPSPPMTSSSKKNFNSNYSLLLVTAFLSGGVACYIGVMGRTLKMDQLGFSETPIAYTVGIGGVVGLIVSPLADGLADHFGSRPILTTGCLIGSSGLLLFWLASTFWPFVIAYTLIGCVFIIFLTVPQKLVGKLVPEQSRGMARSLVVTVQFIGAAIGYLLTGYLAQLWSVDEAFVFGAITSLIPIPLLWMIRTTHNQPDETEGGK